MKSKNIVVSLNWIKELLNRFENNKELTTEINSFENGLRLEVLK